MTQESFLLSERGINLFTFCTIKSQEPSTVTLNPVRRVLRITSRLDGSMEDIACQHQSSFSRACTMSLLHFFVLSCTAYRIIQGCHWLSIAINLSLYTRSDDLQVHSNDRVDHHLQPRPTDISHYHQHGLQTLRGKGDS